MAITHVYIDLKTHTRIHHKDLVGRTRTEHGLVMCTMHYMLQSIQFQIYWAEWRKKSHLIKFNPHSHCDTCFNKKGHIYIQLLCTYTTLSLRIHSGVC